MAVPEMPGTRRRTPAPARRHVRGVLAAVASLGVVLAGCAGARGGGAGLAAPGGTAPAGSPANDLAATSAGAIAVSWRSTLDSASTLLRSGDRESAEALLGAFAVRHDATCQGAEARYTMALLALTSGGGAAAAGPTVVPHLDIYLGSTCLTPQREVEVALVRTLATQLASLTAGVANAPTNEVARLREQLDQTKRELERLKMRVIPP